MVVLTLGVDNQAIRSHCCRELRRDALDVQTVEGLVLHYTSPPKEERFDPSCHPGEAASTKQESLFLKRHPRGAAEIFAKPMDLKPSIGSPQRDGKLVEAVEEPEGSPGQVGCLDEQVQHLLLQMIGVQIAWAMEVETMNSRTMLASVVLNTAFAIPGLS